MLQNVVIMAGGVGMRLRPLTDMRPKPLLPLLDEPVIGYTLRLLRRHGVQHATVALGYRGEDIRAALGDGHNRGVSLSYVQESEPLGTAGSVREAARDMRGTVLVMSGDGLTDCDLTHMAALHVRSGNVASLILKRVDNPAAFGLCETDEDGHICRFVEKPGEGYPPQSLVSTGIYLLERTALDAIPPKGAYDFGRDLFPKLLADGVPLAGLEMQGYWCDIGSQAGYYKAQTDLLTGRVGLPVMGRRHGQGIFAGDCRMERDVKVTGRCYVGRNVRIGGGTVIGPGTVINSGARIGRNAYLENACLWENARIIGGARLKNVVVMPCEHADALQQLASYGNVHDGKSS